MGTLDLSKLKVLIADDTRQMRLLMRNILQAVGVKTVYEANDGTNALKLIASYPIDIVIIDLHMKPAGGIEFLITLRRDHNSPNPFLPVIFATVDSTLETIQAARDAGVSTFLAKPLSVRSLTDKLMFVLKDRRKFIRAKSFCGPDRRFRVDDGFPKARRSSDAQKHPVAEQKVSA